MLNRDVLRATMPKTAAVLDHPRVQADADLTLIIETFADRDAIERVSLDQLSLFFGVMLGKLHDLMQENDRLRTMVGQAATSMSALIRPQ
jgi:hypothetical protein